MCVLRGTVIIQVRVFKTCFGVISERNSRTKQCEFYQTLRDVSTSRVTYKMRCQIRIPTAYSSQP